MANARGPAPKLHDNYKPFIEDLYLIQNLSLDSILQILSEEYYIQIGKRTLERKLQQWNIKKNKPLCDIDSAVLRMRIAALFFFQNLQQEDMLFILLQEGKIIFF